MTTEKSCQVMCVWGWWLGEKRAGQYVGSNVLLSSLRKWAALRRQLIILANGLNSVVMPVNPPPPPTLHPTFHPSPNTHLLHGHPLPLQFILQGLSLACTRPVPLKALQAALKDHRPAEGGGWEVGGGGGVDAQSIQHK